ncbi:TRAP transporter large permease [bacterium LRH843]|nr:TRAP transporter large permease [bacterium LRH843]
MNLLVELLLIFLLLCVFRVPIAFSLGVSSLIVILQAGISAQQVVIQIFKGLGLFPLLAIPFFILAGNIMNYAKITDDLVRLAQALVGRIPGGLGHVNVLTSMIFGGISGSSTADVSATGAVLIPAMKRDGYSGGIAAAITAASSTMGNLIPPSLYMIVYGSIAGVSIKALFLAGIVPGLLVGFSQMIWVYFHARNKNIKVPEPIGVKETGKIFIKTSPALLLVIIIIGGITLGYYTATEAAVIAVLYTLILAFFYYRSLTVKTLGKVFAETSQSTSSILFTIASASIFGWLVAYMDGPKMVSQWFANVSTDPFILLLLIAGLLLILGTFMSEIATIIIFTPIFLQIQEIGGIDPIHMGVVVVMTLCIGLVTPPLGICLLIASQIAEVRFITAVRAAMPLIGVFILTILIVIIFPKVVLFIPNIAP